MPLQATSGAASYDAFGGGVPVVPNYIEECFSCFLYTGNASTQTITNGIDLAGKGGLVWTKTRGSPANFADHSFIDTTRGINKTLNSNSTGAEDTYWAGNVSSFSSTGYGLTGYSEAPTSSGSYNGTWTNQSGFNYASWTFRKQPKFFDVVTWTGNSTAGRQIAHNLGSVPGCIFVKQTNVSGEYWDVYHRSLANNKQLYLNTTSAELTTSSWNSTTPTSTVFTVGDGSSINVSGATYVAYLFAHDAGGFGLTGTDNVISCGSYTGTGASLNVSLGYEPQWILIKDASATGNWRIFDTMRGWPAPSGQDAGALFPNLSNAETANGDLVYPTATGIQLSTNGTYNTSGRTYIYIAIRRGPMKVPTSGTSVFAPLTYTGNGTSGRLISGAGFPPDLLIQTARSASENREFDDRLRGGGSTAMNALFSNSTNAEAADSGSVQLLNQDGFTVRSFGNGSGVTYIGECFRRAPSFFDEVCFDSATNVTSTTQNHNLGVVPELIIYKIRTYDGGWPVISSVIPTQYLQLQTTSAAAGSITYTATATTFTPRISIFFAGYPTSSFVAYLFATCAGVSKVGSYTGNGSSQTINCGFTGGARFVLIKKSSGTGDWMVSDSARGLVSGNDPYLELNNTNAEVTGEDWLDTDSTGFVVNEVSGSNANTNGATYIFLAIA